MRAPRGPDLRPLLAATLIGFAVITGAFDSPKIPEPPEITEFTGPRVDSVSATESAQAALGASGNCYWIVDRNTAYVRSDG
jgi:hypothetical protein